MSVPIPGGYYYVTILSELGHSKMFPKVGTMSYNWSTIGCHYTDTGWCCQKRKRGVPVEPTTLLRCKGVDGSKSPG